MTRKILILISFFALIGIVNAASTMGVSMQDLNGTTTADTNFGIFIYDAATGGNLVFQDWFKNVVNGRAITILAGSVIPLDLNYGQTYYLDINVGASNLTFNGSDRSRFISNVGDLNSAIDNRYLKISDANIIYAKLVDLNQQSVLLQDLNLNGFSIKTNNSKIDFNTNDLTRLTIASDGNIGIGTIIPKNKLNVIGDINTTTGIYTNRIESDKNIIFKTNGMEAMRINQDGKIGIGTNNPTQILDINSTTPYINLTFNGSSNFTGISFYDGATQVGGVQTMGSAFSDTTRRNATELLALYNGTGFFTFRTKNASGVGSEKIRISNDGNLGIATTSPSYKLDVNGSARIGILDNNTTFSSNGFQSMGGTARAWKDLIIIASALKVPAANLPNTETWFGAGDIEGYTFEDAKTEKLFGQVEMQHDYAEGTDINSFHVHMMCNSTNVGDVNWELEYNWENVNGTHGANVILYKIGHCDGTAWKDIRVDFPSISGSTRTIGSIFDFKIQRNGTATDDTFTGNAAVETVGIHYLADTLGSRAIGSK